MHTDNVNVMKKIYTNTVLINFTSSQYDNGSAITEPRHDWSILEAEEFNIEFKFIYVNFTNMLVRIKVCVFHLQHEISIIQIIDF